MKKKRKIKFELIFCSISLVFILFVVIFFGFKLFVNSKKYSNNTIFEVLKVNKTITKDGDIYRFKGESVNNYIIFSNMLFRIVKTNLDGSVDIVLNDSINSLSYNTNSDYINSDISKYLNDVFLDKLDKYYLSKTLICNDSVNNINEYTCKNKNIDNYVKLLDVSDYLNSIDTNTYLNSDENIWLSTKKDKDNVWIIGDGVLSYLDNHSSAYVKPVVTLKNSVSIVSGDGTLENPYTITKKKGVGIGSYIKIDDDLWVVYSKEKKNLRLMLVDNIDSGITKMKYSSKNVYFDPKEENTLAYFLNNDYYNSLSYKKLLVDFEVNTGSYNNSYKDIYSKKQKVKVGIPSIVDLKYSGNSFSYYLLNSKGEEIYYYEDGLFTSQPNLIRPIRPVISIKDRSFGKGNGTLNDPYIIEVK